MPTKREAIRIERRRRQARRKTVQFIAIGIVALAVIVVITLIVVSSSRSNTGTGSAATLAAYEKANSATPILVGTKQYNNAPPITIDQTKQYFATVKMAKGGEFIIQLYPDKAPITVNSFVFLAQRKFFDGTTFHRVLEGFMAQGGDPTGTGSGGPGYQFSNEQNDLQFDKAGVVAMANSGPNTNGSQFFIMFGPYALSESDYTIFGQVTSGMDVVNGLTRRDPTQNPTFTGDAIESVTITVK
jgi:cyclophilin family peptidyl-prolyl cis-trans isomerase